MNSILITGSNRGLGLGLVKTLVKLPKPPNHLFATCRDLEKAVELQELAKEHESIHILEIDVKDFNSYPRIVNKVAEIVKEDGLNVLFNNAGIAPKSTRLNIVKENDLSETFLINTIAPIMLTKAFIPLLKKASNANRDAEMSTKKAAIINMSSILGSIGCNVQGGMYAYRASKSALNAATKSMSIDLNDSKILCISLHPGWVKTDLGGSKAPLDVETSCNKMVELMETLGEKDNGGFFQYDGKKLQW